MRDDEFCHCGSCGHEKEIECYTKQCQCCLSDHQGSFAKNRWELMAVTQIKIILVSYEGFENWRQNVNV